MDYTHDEDTNFDDGFQPPEKGILCGKYRLEEEAGAGGMGVVWKAWDIIGERWVALKFISPKLLLMEGAEKRMVENFGKIHALTHTYICPVYALEKDFTYGSFVVMKWIDGKPLNEVKLPKEKIPVVLGKIADALDHAHTNGVIHRDVKPSNILVAGDDAYLIDFGIAAQIHSETQATTGQFAISGTSAYMSPEQRKGNFQSVPTDEYSLAMVALELLVGSTLPTAFKNLSAETRKVLEKALEENPKKRYATCREFVNALTVATSRKYSVPPVVTRNLWSYGKYILGFFGILLLLLIVFKGCALLRKPKAATTETATASETLEPVEQPEEEKFRESIRPKIAQWGDNIQKYNEILVNYKPESEKAKVQEQAIEADFHALCEAVKEYEQKRRAEYESKLDEGIKPGAPLVTSLEKELEIQKRVLEVLTQEFEVSTQEAAYKLVSEQYMIPSGSTGGIRKVFTVDGIDYAFRWCPAGEFEMGSTEGDSDEKPVHKVKLTQGFWLMETEVTQSMWELVMGSNPSNFKGASNPVEEVSWNDCQEFCRKLSQKLGHQVELPSEAQWEYACRAGTTGAYAGSLAEMGWYRDNSGSTTHAVGQKKPNGWGLYDMHGNVWEWCSDWYGDYSASPTSDPTGPPSGSVRVFRGGSWSNGARDCRSADRYRGGPGYRGSSLGLRPLVVPASKE